MRIIVICIVEVGKGVNCCICLLLFSYLILRVSSFTCTCFYLPFGILPQVASLTKATSVAESERTLLQEELPRLEAERSSLSKTFDALNTAAAEGADAIVSRLTLTKNERRKAEVRAHYHFAHAFSLCTRHFISFGING